MSDGSLSRALRWPLWSWRNLAVTAAALLLVGMAVGRLVGGPGAEPAGPGAARPALGSPTGSSAGASPAPAPPGRTDPSSGAPASLPPGAGSASSTPDEARADAGARTAAAERAGLFVQAWLKPGTPTQRADALRPLAAGRLVAQLAGLPASALAVHPVGSPVVVSVDQAAAAVTVAMSDGRTAVLAMTAEADGWRVSSLSTTSSASTGSTATSAAAAPSPAAAG
jgi:hypothetical protein